jgi:hypothetical protein
LEMAEVALATARQDRSAAEADAERRRSELDDLTRRLDTLAEKRRNAQLEVDRAKPEADRARAAVADAARAATAPQEAQRAASARAVELRAALDAANARRDPDAARELAAATAELERLEAERAAELAEAEARGERDAPPDVRLERAQQRAEELRDVIAVLEPVDVTGVVEARHRLVHIDEAPKVPSAEAMQLADRLETIEARLEAIGALSDQDDPVEVRRRLDEARTTLAEAELAVRGTGPDPDAVRAVEEAHAELLEAIDATEGRMAGPRAQRRLERARELEREALQRLGFQTYTDYRMGATPVPMSPEDLDRLDAAKAEVAEAERAWERLRSKTDLELDRAMAINQQRQLLVEARELLGRRVAPHEATDALRAMRVPLTPPEVVAASLQSVLAEVGVAVEGESLDPDDLVALSDACINEVEQAARRRREAEAELHRLELEIESLGAEVARLEAEAAERRAQGIVEPLDAARERTDVARQRVARDEEAAADVVALSAQLDRAMEAEQAAVGAREAAEARLSEAARAREEADARLTVAEHELSEAVRLQNQAAGELRRLEEAGAESELARLVAAVREREEQLQRAQDELQRVRDAAADVETEYAELNDEYERLAVQLAEARQDSPYTDPLLAPVDDDDPGTEDVEWYLLARLAAQRGASYAGSLPLLLDDALRDLHPIEIGHLLTRLEQMADAVQVIVVSDEPAISAWAARTGPERAAVVSASRAD